MPKLKVYQYDGCSTCKNALKFLDGKKIAYEKIPIVEKPPTRGELKEMLKYVGGNIKKLLNTSGQVYREMGLGEKLSGMTDAQVIDLLARNGKLVKRPFVLADGKGWVGFKEEEWKAGMKG